MARAYSQRLQLDISSLYSLVKKCEKQTRLSSSRQMHTSRAQRSAERISLGRPGESGVQGQAGIVFFAGIDPSRSVWGYVRGGTSEVERSGRRG
eukprot:294220-Rhodomonas_salina.3